MSTSNTLNISENTTAHPRYDAYKDSGVEWLGEIPEHWELVQLKYCLDRITSGATPASTEDEYWTTAQHEGTPWVAIGDMTNSFHVRQTEKLVTPAGIEEADLDILPRGTLLYSIYASLGKVAVLNVPAATNQAILGLVPKQSQTDQGYLAYWLMYMEQHLDLLSSSNTQDNLSAGRVRLMPVCVSPLPEQRAIAAYLDRETERIDALKDKIRDGIDRLKEYRTALISAAVTGQIDVRAEAEMQK